MITIINISDTKFSYNGINYFKNFTPFVTGNKVSIVNTYDACISLTNFPTIYSDISVDGVTYGSVAALQNALLPVLFNRTFSQSGSLTVGYIPKATGSNTLGNSLIFENGYNIGVGTAAPNYSSTNRRVLDINGATQSMLALSVGGVGKGFLFHTGTDLLVSNEGNGAIKLNTNGSQKVVIEAGGNVGIGTTIPSSKLHISQSSFNPLRIARDSVSDYSFELGGSGEFYIKNNLNSVYPISILSGGNVGIGTTSPSGLWSGINKTLQIAGGSGVASELVQSRPSATITRFLSGTSDTFGVYTADALKYELYTSGLARMSIFSNGNVGIGTSISNYRLTIAPAATYGNAEDGNINIIANPSGGTTSAPTTVGGIVFGDQNVTNAYAGRIAVLRNSPSNTTASHMRFYTNSGGGNNSTAERVRITSDGDVCINRTSSLLSSKFSIDQGGSGSTNIALNHFYSGNKYVDFGWYGTSIGSISNVGGSAVAYNTTSDYRLKEDFKNYSGLDLILQIKTYDYKWKKSENRMFGVIAHELQEVIPYAVTGEKDGEQMQSVDYSKLVPILVQAIQELKSEIQILKN